MRFYNIFEDNSEKIGKTYPQSQEFYTSYNINDNSYFNNIKKFDEHTIFPKFVLHKKAIKTDLISAAYVTGRLIISEKLKNIVFEYCNERMQFAPITLINNKIEYRYWLMNNFDDDFELVNFKLSTIEKIDMLTNHCDIVNPLSKLELDKIIKTKKPHEGVRISKLVLNHEINQHVFFIGTRTPPFYISEYIKEKIEAAGCTGIKFVEYDKIYP